MRFKGLAAQSLELLLKLSVCAWGAAVCSKFVEVEANYQG